MTDRSPQEILRWAAERFAPRLTFATGFGVEGCVILHLIAKERLPVDVFTLDTGLLFPETYALWARLERELSITIRAVRPDQTVDEQALSYGPRLWESDPDTCCDLRKVVPLRRELARFDAWITAIRREQTPDRANASEVEDDGRFGLVKVNPLVSLTSSDVARYVAEHDVPVNPLNARGYPSIGCWPCTTPVAFGEDARAGRWRGKAKTECGLHRRPAHETNSIERNEHV